MRQLLFRVNGITRRRSKSLRRLARPTNAGALLSAGLVVVGVNVYGLGLIIPNLLLILSGAPAVVVHGELLVGTNVLVVRDVSESMQGTEEDLNSQIAQLKASGMMTSARRAQGFGVSPTGSRGNLLHQLEEALESNPALDTVYAFSDFAIFDSPVWKSDRAGYDQLQTLLARQGVRLYLGTVRYPPPTELVVAARESGGGLIQ